MGYTHYWSGSTKCSQPTWNRVKGDLLRLVEAVGIPLAGADGTGLALIGERICFNGEGDRDSHETFSMSHNKKSDDFCKTARKPYDLIVCAALIIIQHYVRDFRVSSDGDETDWAASINACQQHLGYGVYPCSDGENPNHAPPISEPIPEKEFVFKRCYTDVQIKEAR